MGYRDYVDDRGLMAPAVIKVDGRVVINPRDAQLERAGYKRRPAAHVPTQEEIAENARLLRVEDLKRQLAATDYKAIKWAEGWLTDEEYAPVKAERQALRDEINALEGGE